MLQDILRAFRLWQQYGGLAKTALAVGEEIMALDGGKLVEHIEAILKKHGIDLGAMALAGAPKELDLRHIEDIQKALNLMHTSGALTPDGFLGRATLDAVMDFQRSVGLHVNGIPDFLTVSSLTHKLKAQGVAVRD